MNHPDEILALQRDARNAEILAHAVIWTVDGNDLSAFRHMLVDPDGEYKMSDSEADAWIEEHTEFINTYCTIVYEVVERDIFRLLVAARSP